MGRLSWTGRNLPDGDTVSISTSPASSRRNTPPRSFATSALQAASLRATSRSGCGTDGHC